MKCIGLTGGIGSGKSLAANWLKKKNIPVIDADQLARDVVEPGSEGLKAVAAHFGQDVLTADGQLDRARLASHVFDDPTARQELESILHPRIFDALQRKLNMLEKQGHDIAVFEAPLLFEAHLDGAMDAIILVWSDKDKRIERLSTRNGYSKAEAEKRIEAQMDTDEQKKKTSFQVENNASMESFYEKLAQVWSAAVAAAKNT